MEKPKTNARASEMLHRSVVSLYLHEFSMIITG